MKITKKNLQKLIKEETAKLLKEQPLYEPPEFENEEERKAWERERFEEWKEEMRQFHQAALGDVQPGHSGETVEIPRRRGPVYNKKGRTKDKWSSDNEHCGQIEQILWQIFNEERPKPSQTVLMTLMDQAKECEDFRGDFHDWSQSDDAKADFSEDDPYDAEWHQTQAIKQGRKDAKTFNLKENKRIRIAINKEEIESGQQNIRENYIEVDGVKTWIDPHGPDPFDPWENSPKHPVYGKEGGKAKPKPKKSVASKLAKGAKKLGRAAIPGVGAAIVAADVLAPTKLGRSSWGVSSEEVKGQYPEIKNDALKRVLTYSSALDAKAGRYLGMPPRNIVHKLAGPRGQQFLDGELGELAGANTTLSASTQKESKGVPMKITKKTLQQIIKEEVTKVAIMESDPQDEEKDTDSLSEEERVKAELTKVEDQLDAAMAQGPTQDAAKKAPKLRKKIAQLKAKLASLSKPKNPPKEDIPAGDSKEIEESRSPKITKTKLLNILMEETNNVLKEEPMTAVPAYPGNPKAEATQDLLRYAVAEVLGKAFTTAQLKAATKRTPPKAAPKGYAERQRKNRSHDEWTRFWAAVLSPAAAAGSGIAKSMGSLTTWISKKLEIHRAPDRREPHWYDGRKSYMPGDISPADKERRDLRRLRRKAKAMASDVIRAIGPIWDGGAEISAAVAKMVSSAFVKSAAVRMKDPEAIKLAKEEAALDSEIAGSSSGLDRATADAGRDAQAAVDALIKKQVKKSVQSANQGLLNTAQQQIDDIPEPDMKAMAKALLDKHVAREEARILKQIKAKPNYQNLKFLPSAQRSQILSMIDDIVKKKIDTYLSGAKLRKVPGKGYEWVFSAGGGGDYKREHPLGPLENPYEDKPLAKEGKRKINLRII